MAHTADDYWEAADRQDPHAMFCLGWCFANGAGVPQDSVQAVEWYLKAAKSGSVEAMYNLAVCYGSGQGAPRNRALAAQWYRQAAEEGDTDAMFELAECLAHGHGVPCHPAQAATWYRRAAENGDAEAMLALGLSLTTGRGVAQDHQQAFAWYSRAAEQGLAAAMFELGNCYCYGQGVPQNVEQATAWYRNAADHGHPQALDHLLRTVRPTEWSLQELVVWLERNGLAELVPIFHRERIDGYSIAHLTNQSLEELGVPAFGLRVKFLKQRDQLLSRPTPPPPPLLQQQQQQQLVLSQRLITVASAIDFRSILNLGILGVCFYAISAYFEPYASTALRTAQLDAPRLVVQSSLYIALVCLYFVQRR